MTNFENGNFTGTGVPSVEMLIENGKTKTDLGDKQGAYKDLKTAIDYYPQDYRAYYEMLRLITDSFSNTNAFNSNKEEILKCYKALTKLNIPEDFKNQVNESLSLYFNKLNEYGSLQSGKVFTEIDATYETINSNLKMNEMTVNEFQSKINNYDADIEQRKEELEFEQLAAKREISGIKASNFDKYLAYVCFGLAVMFALMALFGVGVESKILMGIVFVTGLGSAVIGFLVGSIFGLIGGLIIWSIIGYAAITAIGQIILAILFIALGVFLMKSQNQDILSKGQKKQQKSIDLQNEMNETAKQIQYDIDMKDSIIADYQKKVDEAQKKVDALNNIKNKLDQLVTNSDIKKNYVYKAMCNNFDIENNYYNAEFNEIASEAGSINIS